MSARSGAIDAALDAFTAGPGVRAVAVEALGAAGDSQARWERNGARLMPSASVVKVAIACAAWDRAAAGALDLAAHTDVQALPGTDYCTIQAAFHPQRALSLRDLIGLMLIVSDNPATVAVTNAVGLEHIQDWLTGHGFAQTTLTVGFSDGELGAPLRANTTTALEALALLRRAYAAPQYAVVADMLRNNLRNDRMPRLLPDSAHIFHKTGSLKGLCHDVGVVEDGPVRFAAAFLTDAQPDVHAAAADIATATAALHAAFALG